MKNFFDYKHSQYTYEYTNICTTWTAKYKKNNKYNRNHNNYKSANYYVFIIYIYESYFCLQVNEYRLYILFYFVILLFCLHIFMLNEFECVCVYVCLGSFMGHMHYVHDWNMEKFDGKCKQTQHSILLALLLVIQMQESFYHTL